ncbi:MAG: MFS transporter [Jiangellaceae bacterium]
MTSISDRRRRLVFVVLGCGTLLYTVSLALVTPVLGQVRQNLGTSQVGATWVLTAYLVSSCALTPICGRLGDIVGKKRMLVIALSVSTLGLVVAALATSLAPMLVGRTIQGLGGGIVPLAFGIARDELPREKLGRAVSVLSSMMAAGAAGGVVLAGPIVEGLGYHWLFWLPGIATGVLALAAAGVIPASSVRAPGRIAWGAAVLLTGWLVSLLVAISEAPRLGWSSAPVVGCMAAAIVLTIAWAWCELHVDTPLIDLRMLRTRLIWAVDSMTFLSGTAMFATLAFTTQLTQTPASLGYGFGLSLTMAGIVQLPTAATGFLAGMTISRVVPPLDPKWIALGGLTALACGLTGLAWFHDEIWHICLANALAGGGLGAAAACQATLISTGVRPDETAAANGVSMTIRVIGGIIGTTLMSSILAAHVADATGEPREIGYSIGFTVLAGLVVCSGVAAMCIPRVRRQDVVAVVERNPLRDRMDETPVASLQPDPESESRVPARTIMEER